MTIEACGFGRDMDEAAEVTLDGDGVTLLIGTMASGQGHHTVYAQIVADTLGLPATRVRTVQGDTGRIGHGNGTGASRSITVGGNAVLAACRDLIEAGRPEAARLLQAPPERLRFAAGAYHDGLARLELRALAPLAGRGHFAPRAYTFPVGCHVAEVEVDPDTGRVTLLAYTIVHDVGTVINPTLVEAQLVGGVAQGIGQALLECAVCEPASGQPLSGSFMDYAVPRAADLPRFRVALMPTPAPSNPLGAKSCGEAGTTAAPPAVMAALLDALAPVGVVDLPMPATPAAVHAALRRARAASPPPAIPSLRPPARWSPDGAAARADRPCRNAR